MVRLRELHKQGKLNSLQERLLFANERPYEELYDVTIDANQYVNLASDENMQEKLDEMRTILNDWEENTNDQGRTIESPEVYASTMEAVIKSLEGNTRLPNRAKVLRENVALMKKWAVEGK